jgi:ferric-dicitrate binding protein FerR (iron transport regulator)
MVARSGAGKDCATIVVPPAGAGREGEQRRVVVAPELSIELNTQTSVALRPAQNETRIELISGEASVMAKLPSSKPLVMLAGDGRITALQADFNARCLERIVSVTCLDGIVDVEQGRNMVRLRKREQVSYSGTGIEASVPVDAAQVTAWKAGLLIFRDRPLASVVDEVNRYRSGKIIITNADLKRRLAAAAVVVAASASARHGWDGSTLPRSIRGSPLLSCKCGEGDIDVGLAGHHLE